jgi:chromosome segregation ATPase
MKRKSLLYRLTFALLIGILIMPPQPVRAQWTVFDPAQYTLQVSKRIEEANRWIQHYTNLANQLTTLGGVLKAADDLVAKQKKAISTMSNIGRTVRASLQLERQLRTLVTTRLRAFKSIDDRLRKGIFDPEADMRDFEEYLRDSIGRTSQDTIANLERLARMDNQLERIRVELAGAHEGLAKAEGKKMAAEEELRAEEAKPESERCAQCIASIIEKISNADLLIAHYTKEIARLDSEIKERVQKYNIQMQERVRFGEQVQSMNEAWSQFNNSLDELQRVLSKVR